ncbi:putative GATA transcription factor 22 [Musa acuminata AAA Group]|uniref:putative GATA transcription factor 22 n=1 Tax=Musa acuminata AAA Group TaxID=214697 RepID=UPI0031DD9933
MSPFDLNHAADIPLSEGDQDRTSHPLFTVVAANETSSFSCPIFFNDPHDHGADGGHDSLPKQLPQQEPKDHSLMIGELNYHWVCTTEEEDEMGIMKKMMMSSEGGKPRGDQIQAEQVRVCSNCSTTKTPLWRSGPHGPKSLCNACGIRQRKARRAMEAAAMNSGVIPSDATSGTHREKKQDMHDSRVPFKKRKLLFRGTNSAALHEVFPQDERDAATLLMALSCGLIRS